MRVVVRNRNNVSHRGDIEPGKSIAVISITNPQSQHPDITEWPELRGVLRLKFDDVDEREGLEFNYVSMTDMDGDRVARFVNKHKDVDVLIINCDAGICRSSGMAGAILKHLTGSDDQIFKDRQFVPNMWVNKKTREALMRFKGPVAELADAPVSKAGVH